MSTTFVGRADHLAVLAEALSKARCGEPQTVVVDGPAGAGKTALVSEFLGTLRELDALQVEAVAGDPTETQLEYGLLDQILSSAPVWPPAAWSDPFSAGAMLLRHWGSPADGVTTVLSVDDAHLADPSSLQAMNFAMRRLRRDRVLVLMTVRTEQATGLPSGTTRIAEEHRTRVTLGGLGTDDVVELAARLGRGHLSRRAAERLRAHTEGNPLHLRLLLAEVPFADLQQLSHDHPLPAPPSLRLLVVGQLSETSSRAQRLACAAAVLGENPRIVDVLAVADGSPGGVAHADASDFDELEEAGILRVTAGGEIRAQFTHPVVRAAIYDDLGSTRRSELHRRAAVRVDPPQSWSHRLAAARGPDPALGRDLRQRAAQQVQAGDVRGAGLSLVAGSEVSDDGEAGELLLAGVEKLLLAGDAASAAPHMARVAALGPTAKRLHVQARMAWLSGRLEEASVLGRRAWELGSGLDATQRDQVAALLAQVDILCDRGAEAAQWASRALEDGRLDSDQGHLTRAAQAHGLCTSGRAAEGLRVLECLPAAVTEVPSSHHPELAARGVLRRVEDDLVGACTDLRAVASLIPRQLEPFRIVALGALAETEIDAGYWTAADRHAEQALSLAEDMEQPWLAGFLHAVAARTPAGRGDWARAQAHVDAAHTAAVVLGDPGTSAYADDAAIWVAACRNDPHEVVVRAESLLRLADGPPLEPGILSWQPRVARALVDLGRLDEAAAVLVQAERLARSRGRVSRLAPLMRTRGELAAARDEPEAAADAFTEAVRLGAGAGNPFEHAMTVAAYGEFLRARDDQPGAVDRLREARARFVALGATPFLNRCDAQLTACGVEDLPPAPVLDKLTPQERVVAELVCSGRTNREIADELVLSVKTVGFHLTNVYSKLGVHSRVGLLTELTSGPH